MNAFLFSCGLYLNKLLFWYQEEIDSCASVGIAALYPKDIYQAKKFLNSWLDSCSRSSISNIPYVAIICKTGWPEGLSVEIILGHSVGCRVNTVFAASHEETQASCVKIVSVNLTWQD